MNYLLWFHIEVNRSMKILKKIRIVNFFVRNRRAYGSYVLTLCAIAICPNAFIVGNTAISTNVFYGQSVRQQSQEVGIDTIEFYGDVYGPNHSKRTLKKRRGSVTGDSSQRITNSNTIIPEVSGYAMVN